MRRYIPYVIIFFIFAALLGLSARQKPRITGNLTIIDEINQIAQRSMEDEEGNINVTLKDLQNLKEIVKGDKIAESYVKELEWLVEHNESQHIMHTTSFMSEYIETGKDILCVPHELWHISLFIKHDNIDYARKQVRYVEKKYKTWENSIEKKRRAYPQFYKSLNDLKVMIKEATAKLKLNDFSNNTLEQLELIGSMSVC